MKIFDFETYFLPSEVVAERIALMDRFGIRKAVLCPALSLWQREEKNAVENVSRVNAALHEAVKAYPERLAGVAALQSFDIPAAVAELELCVEKYGFIGCQVFSAYSNMPPDSDDFWPVFAKAEELGVAVYLHPVVPPMPRIVQMGPQMHLLGGGNDVAITAARLIAKGLFDRYPRLQIVLGTMGDVMLAVAERMDHYAMRPGQEKAPAINTHPFTYYLMHNFLVSTGGVCSNGLLQCARDMIGSDHVLAGSGYPTYDMEHLRAFMATVQLLDDERRNIFHDNAVRMAE